MYRPVYLVTLNEVFIFYTEALSKFMYNEIFNFLDLNKTALFSSLEHWLRSHPEISFSCNMEQLQVQY